VQDQPVISVMTPDDVRLALDWAAAEGWNPGLDDAAAFRAADPEGFLIARVDGEPAAVISVVRYGDSFGFLGLYIAAPSFRGRGIGWSIWQAGMARLAGRTVGLDGVVAQQANYRKSGFVLAHRNMRWQGVPALPPAGSPSSGVVPVGPDLVEAVLRYDRPFFPAARDAFLRTWLAAASSPPPCGEGVGVGVAGEGVDGRGQRYGLRPPPTPAAAPPTLPAEGEGRPSRIGRALLGDGALAGYGVIRRCRAGLKIGPLFADDAPAAEALFDALAATAPGEAIALDLPEPNAAAIALAESRGLRPVFETARMVRGDAPSLPLPRIFGITTFELG
jgi:hypothetical protein